MKEYPYRISEAAIGKIYAELINMTRNAEIPSGQLHATMCAVFGYIESEQEPAADAGIDPSVWERFKSRIDRSARRSASARARAAKRRSDNSAPAAPVSLPRSTPQEVRSVYGHEAATSPHDSAYISEVADTSCLPAAETVPVIDTNDRQHACRPGNGGVARHHVRDNKVCVRVQRSIPIRKVKISKLGNSRRNRRRWTK